MKPKKPANPAQRGLARPRSLLLELGLVGLVWTPMAVFMTLLLVAFALMALFAFSCAAALLSFLGLMLVACLLPVAAAVLVLVSVSASVARVAHAGAAAWQTSP